MISSLDQIPALEDDSSEGDTSSALRQKLVQAQIIADSLDEDREDRETAYSDLKGIAEYGERMGGGTDHSADLDEMKSTLADLERWKNEREEAIKMMYQNEDEESREPKRPETELFHPALASFDELNIFKGVEGSRGKVDSKAMKSVESLLLSTPRDGRGDREGDSAGVTAAAEHAKLLAENNLLSRNPDRDITRERLNLKFSELENEVRNEVRQGLSGGVTTEENTVAADAAQLETQLRTFNDELDSFLESNSSLSCSLK